MCKDKREDKKHLQKNTFMLNHPNVTLNIYGKDSVVAHGDNHISNSGIGDRIDE